jgi:NAD(P)H-quinone oxidoreductase subunit 4
MGGYGLIQTWNCYLILFLYLFSLWLVMIGAVQITYAAPTSTGQQNRKRRIVLIISYGFCND